MSAESSLLDFPLGVGAPASPAQFQGYWQFTGSSIAIGLRPAMDERTPNSPTRPTSLELCEELDLTDFVKEMELLPLTTRGFAEDGREFKRFAYESAEFSAWLVVGRSIDRWKFCSAGLTSRASGSESFDLQFEAIRTGDAPESSVGALGLALPFVTESVGTRFNQQREAVAILLLAALDNAQVRDELQRAGFQLSNGNSLSPEVWSGSLQGPGKTTTFGCQLVQLGPARCVIMVTKEQGR